MQAKKKFGQNFISDLNLINKIARQTKGYLTKVVKDIGA